MKISKNKSRRGITLTETVIGIAIITLISAATLTLMLSQAKMRRKTVEVMEATAIAENALECYAHAGDVGEDFKVLLSLALGINIEDINLENLEKEDGTEIQVNGMILNMRKSDKLYVTVTKNGKPNDKSLADAEAKLWKTEKE